MPMTENEIDALLRHAGAPPTSAAGACLETPEFDLGRLLAATADDAAPDADADVAADPGALDHLARCAFCRALVREARAPVNELLLRRLDRAWEAPSATRDASRIAAPADDAPAVTPLRPRRWSWAIASGAIALAASLLFLILRPAPPPDAPEFSLVGPFGGLTEVRADVPESNVFVPDSQVRLVLHPKAAPAPGTVLALFRVDPAGLARLPDNLARVQPNGAWSIEGEGRVLFGDTPGEKRLLIVVAGSAAALAALGDLERQPPSALDARPGIRSYELRVEYRARP